MIDNGYALGVIAVMAVITYALRALPFVASRWLQRHDVVRRLGRFLPLAIMTLLLLHAIVGAARTCGRPLAGTAGRRAGGAAAMAQPQSTAEHRRRHRHLCAAAQPGRGLSEPRSGGAGPASEGCIEAG